MRQDEIIGIEHKSAKYGARLRERLLVQGCAGGVEENVYTTIGKWHNDIRSICY